MCCLTFSQSSRKRFEAYLRAFAEAVVCPGCQSGSVEKQLSTFAFAGTGGASAAPASGGGCCGGGCGCRH